MEHGGQYQGNLRLESKRDLKASGPMYNLVFAKGKNLKLGGIGRESPDIQFQRKVEMLNHDKQFSRIVFCLPTTNSYRIENVIRLFEL